LGYVYVSNKSNDPEYPESYAINWLMIIQYSSVNAPLFKKIDELDPDIGIL
jgi:hypothetical protein